VKILSLLLLVPLLAVAQTRPDPSKPVTHLIVEELGGSLRAERPNVVQWWHEEAACKDSAKAITKHFAGQRKFLCVRVLGEDV
jgi:hypothetical protein